MKSDVKELELALLLHQYVREMLKQREIFYEGRVQGVGFRYTVKQIAAGYEVRGHIANLPDGRVHLILQGEAKEVAGMEQAILESHLKGFIRKVQAEDVVLEKNLKGFEIDR